MTTPIDRCMSTDNGQDVALTLTRKLPDIDPPTRRGDREALQWCWLVAIDAWAVGAPLGKLRPRGMELLKQVPLKFFETR